MKHLRLMGLFLLIILVVACSQLDYPQTAVTTPTGWWYDAVFYEIFVRSFYDSSGDGNGDINGLIAKLDYLNDGDPTTDTDLGVTALWLMPITDAASYHGYDTLDYYNIDPDYGTLDDFQRLLDEAHARGIRVIIDLVLNHTASGHPWFQFAQQDPNSDFRSWYRFIPADPIDFYGPDRQVVWHPASGGGHAGGHYFGYFDATMPDLNYTNPDVTAQMQDVTRFWLEDIGVDGFRLDAVRHLIEAEQDMSNTPATHEWLSIYDDYIDTFGQDILTVGEVWDEPVRTAPYVRDGELDLVFEFTLAERILFAVNYSDPATLRDRLDIVFNEYPPGQYATFLSNHDQNRVASTLTELNDNPAKLKLAATTLLTLPGVPFIYYGEEIGMTGRGDHLNIRRPMQWSPEQFAGFSTTTPWLPVNEDYLGLNVELQGYEPDSLWHHYQQLIALRLNHVALRHGSLTTLESDCDGLFPFLRYMPASGDVAEEAVLVVLNLGRNVATDCTLSLAESALAPGSYAATDLLHNAAAANVIVDDNGRIPPTIILPTIAAHQGHILLLQK